MSQQVYYIHYWTHQKYQHSSGVDNAIKGLISCKKDPPTARICYFMRVISWFSLYKDLDQEKGIALISDVGVYNLKSTHHGK